MKYRSSKSESLTTDYLWSFGATALPLVSIFIASLIIARRMGPEVVGLISWTMALATVFLIVGKFGVEGAASRLISEYNVSSPDRVPGLVRSSVLLRIIFTVPTAVAAAVFAEPLAHFFKEDSLVPLFRLTGLLIFAVSLNELAALMIIGIKRFRQLFMMRFAMLVLRVSLVLIAVYFSMGAVGVLGAYIVTAIVPGFAVLAILFGIKTDFRADTGEESVFKRLFILSVPLAVSGASVTIYMLLDKLMLGYFEGPGQVGLYTMARNIVETSLFPTFALVMILRPALAGAYAEGDRTRCSDIVNRSIISAFVYSSCVVVVLACLARPLIIGLFTEKFEVTAGLLILFLPLIVMRSMGAVILPGLIAADRAGTYARLTLAGAIMNFILNIVLIPLWGTKGAVAATLMSYLPIEVLGLRSVAAAFPGIWRAGDSKRALKTAAAGVCIYLVYAGFIPDPGNLLITIIHAALITFIFAGSLLALGVFRFAEIVDFLKPFLKFSGTR